MDRLTAAVTTTLELSGLLLIVAAISIGVGYRYGLVGALGVAGFLILIVSVLVSISTAARAAVPKATKAAAGGRE